MGDLSQHLASSGKAYTSLLVPVAARLWAPLPSPSLLRTLLYTQYLAVSPLRPLVCDVSGHSERADRAVRTLLYDAAHSQLRLEDGSITSTHYEACLNFDGAF